MKKWLMAVAAVCLIASLSVPALAHHGRGRAVRTATQCANSSVCMVDGVCNGTCTGTGDCAYYNGCNSTCPGNQSCIDNGTCLGGHQSSHSGYGQGCGRRHC